MTVRAALREPRKDGRSAGGHEVSLLLRLLNITERGLFAVILYFSLLHCIIFTKA